MRVMRANLDGSKIETLVETGQATRIAVTRRSGASASPSIPSAGQIYWTQKGPDNAELGRIFRANIEIPKGETAANRSDIEVLFDRLPEPIDLELDLTNRVLYWTDRGDPPRGNTVNRASVDAKPDEPRRLCSPSDGRDRHRAGCSGRSNVHDRSGRLALFRQARWIGEADTALRSGKPHRHCLR